jgi:hypothetical protein
MSDDNPGPDPDVRKTWMSYSVVVGGLILIGIFYLVSIYRYTSASDVNTVMAPVVGVIGTVIGAYFGVHAGASGKDKIEKDRNTLQRLAYRVTQPQVRSPNVTGVADLDSAITELRTYLATGRAPPT